MSYISSSSPVSGCASFAESDANYFPPTLANEEIQLALNKDASEAELEKAIVRCKHLVLESDNCSPLRKWLVRHLIELRLRLQECRDAQLDPLHPRNKSSGVSTRTIRGHHLVLQPFLHSTSYRYCDHCTGAIWHVIQAWYKCDDCGYSCHHKCITSILRECAHVTATERGNYELEICPDVGLAAQQYKCAECRTALPLSNSIIDADSYRQCDYNGKYYCFACHWGGQAIIPARVLHNWDFEPRPVCQASLQQLRITANRPLLNIEQLNPALFTHIQEMSLVRRLRRELYVMWRYLTVCRVAQTDRLLWHLLQDSPHLVETPDLYSLQNLVDTHSGELLLPLETLQCQFVEHIKDKCDVCRGRGHICEICSNNEVLYQFDSLAVTCPECNAVFHKNCFKRKVQCPKCMRLQNRSKSAITS